MTRVNFPFSPPSRAIPKEKDSTMPRVVGRNRGEVPPTERRAGERPPGEKLFRLQQIREPYFRAYPAVWGPPGTPGERETRTQPRVSRGGWGEQGPASHRALLRYPGCFYGVSRDGCRPRVGSRGPRTRLKEHPHCFPTGVRGDPTPGPVLRVGCDRVDRCHPRTDGTPPLRP